MALGVLHGEAKALGTWVSCVKTRYRSVEACQIKHYGLFIRETRTFEILENFTYLLIAWWPEQSDTSRQAMLKMKRG